MSESTKYDALTEAQIREYDQVAAQMKKRDEHLLRQLRRMRLVVRTLDLGFGFIHCVLR